MADLHGVCDTQPLVAFAGVTLRHHGREWFAGLDWDLRLGEQWGIVGGNGAGKTLLAQALAGRVQVLRGAIHHGPPPATGHRVVHLSFESQAEIVTHCSPYYQARYHSAEAETGRTVADLLSRQEVEGVSPYQVLADDDPAAYAARQAQVCALLGIAALLPRPVLQLSHGETRKVMLARALLQEPGLLVLDDPYAGLDVAYRATLRELLGQLMAAGYHLVFLTRYADELPPGVTQVLEVADGAVVYRGPRAGWAPRPAMAPPRAPLPELPPPPPAPPELVRLRQVRVVYGASVILTDVNWTVRAGECWALQGPNGSGKTTLLSLLNGDNPQAYANDIRLFGRPRGSGESIWDLKRQIGWVAPEMQAHYAPATACREVVASGFFDSIGLYREPTAEQAAAVARWLAGLGLADHAEQPFGALSAGEQRLVLFARALVKNPPLLVLDEPCVGLDPANRDRIVRLVDALGRQPGRALIYVTHHEEELPPAITHRLRLAQGRVAACGPR